MMFHVTVTGPSDNGGPDFADKPITDVNGNPETFENGQAANAHRPGLYVFHQGEEKGCLGSHWIEHNTPELLTGLDAAIAFDRGGTDEIITHQMGQRLCSETYGKALATALNKTAGLDYRTSDAGVYTDTEVYGRIVPECINVAVGYYGQHGPRETLDVAHLVLLRDAMLTLDALALPVSRDPSVMDYGFDFMDPNDCPPMVMGRARLSSVDDAGYEQWAASWRFDPDADNSGREFLDAVMDHPDIAVEMLEACGIDVNDFMDAAWADNNRQRGRR